MPKVASWAAHSPHKESSNVTIVLWDIPIPRTSWAIICSSFSDSGAVSAEFSPQPPPAAPRGHTKAPLLAVALSARFRCACVHEKPQERQKLARRLWLRPHRRQGLRDRLERC